MMRSFLAALQFLTCIPVSVSGLSEREIGRSAAFFPVVGVVVGAAMVGFYRLSLLALPRPAARILVLAALVAVSGAFHLDGLADSADGLYGATGREEALRIMKDPRTGPMGVVAIVIVLMLKAAAAVTLPEEAFRGGLLAMPVAGRGAMVLALALPSARPSGLTGLFARHRLRADPCVAVILMSGAALVALGPAGLAALLGSLTAAGWLLLRSWRRIRGVTGDVCGAVSEVAECAFLLALLAAWTGGAHSVPVPY
jgi:adenosylcobinamide-GDP ribazoletransferase